jgi:hypothetical protein
MTLTSVIRGTARTSSRRLALFLVLAVLFGGAWAQQPRPVPLPANAIYGDMKSFRYPEAQMGKKVVRFSPGARIYDVNNLIIQPSMVPARASVLFQLDINGQVAQMWLLRPDEAKAAQERAKKNAKK